MRTESEARKLWCPMARVAIQPGPTSNDFDPDYDPCCIASACMWWEWGAEREFLNANGDADSERVGYCGKMGQP